VSGGGNNVSGVDSSQGNTVDLEWARDQQGVVLQVLQVDNSLASESTGQEDQDSAWNQRGSQLLWARSLSGLLGDWSVLSLVPLRSLNEVSIG
jgi:hypothetical protein